MTDTPDVQPWDRREEESPEAFAAFQHYRDRDPRSIRETAKDLGKTHTIISRWSVAYDWLDRCLAYDRWRDRAVQQAALRDYVDARSDWSKLARGLIGKAARALVAIPDEKVTASAAATMAKVGVDIERSLYGEDPSGTSEPPLTPDELARLGDVPGPVDSPERRAEILKTLRDVGAAELPEDVDVDSLEEALAT